MVTKLLLTLIIGIGGIVSEVHPDRDKPIIIKADKAKIIHNIGVENGRDK